MKRAWPVLVLPCGLVIGWLNYHASDDVQAVAAALLAAAFGFAVWRPRAAWWVVPALWLAVPVSGAIANANHHHPGVARPAPLYETAVALIFPVLGAALGAGLRTILRPAGH